MTRAHATAICGLLLLVAPGLRGQELAIDERPATAGEWGFRPVDGGDAETNPPPFVWRPQGQAAGYEWQAARDSGFTDAVRSRDDLPWNVHCPPQPFASGTWSWRFRFRTTGGRTSPWSRTRTFRVADDTPLFALPSREQVRERVPAGHPRLFVRPEQVPRLRTLARGELKEEFARLRARCDGLLQRPPSTEEPPKYPPGTVRLSEEWRKIWWGNRTRTIAVLDSAAQLAFVRLLGGDEKYGALAKRLLLEAARWDPLGATGYRYNDEAGMPYAYHFARTYTLLHDLLSDEERAVCREAMTVRGREMFRHLCPRHLWKPYSSHSNRAWHFLGEVGIAFRGEIPDAEQWLAFALDVFGACYPVWSDTDGGWHEGLAYWRSYLGRFTWWADVMREAVGIDAYQKPFFSRVGDFALYVQPPGTRGGGLGDLCGRLVSDGNAALVGLFAQQAHNPYWQWYAEAHGPRKSENSFVGFLRAAGSRIESRPPTDLPTAKLFSGTGVAALNTTLLRADDNVELIFKSSPFGTQSHGYEAQNSFLLYAFGERLLIRSGRRDVYGSEHHTKWMWSTRSVNSVTVSGRGQFRRSPRAVGRITSFATTPDHDWVEGEAGSAYEHEITSFRRGILFAKPDLVVVLDRLESPTPETYDWWLHAEEPFAEVGDRELRVESGAAACRVRFLWPAQLSIAQTDRFDPPPRPRIKLVEHHLTASTTTPAKGATFVTLLRPHRASEQGRLDAELTPLDGGFRVDVREADGSRRLVLLRTRDGATLSADGVTTDATAAAVRYDPDGRIDAAFRTDDGSLTLNRDTPEDQAGAFRVITYNVLVAFGNYRVGDPYHPGDVRKQHITRWLAAQRPDVLALQEMNGYTAERLLDEARAWGHEHAVMLKESGYPTALTSRTPIEVVERGLKGMHHGLMRCRTAGIDFVVVHLWPFRDAQRLREITPALEMAARARAEGRPVVMLGDFNAVARQDLDLFGDRGLERYRRWKWEEVDGRPRTDVIDAVLEAGYVDLWAKHRGEVIEVYPPRIDFVFASPDLAAKSTSARWLAETERLRDSDHPAVVADFRWPRDSR